jgi:hypothetical protein
LARHLPAVASIAGGATELDLVTSGDDPRLALTMALAETLTVVPGALTIATTTLTALLSWADRGDEPAAPAFEVAGAITAVGATQAGTVRLTLTPAGFQFRATLASGRTSPLTVAGLCRGLLDNPRSPRMRLARS